MSQNISTFRGAALEAVRFDTAAHDQKGYTFVTTDPRGSGKMRFYGAQGKPAGSHFSFVEDASSVYGGPAVLFQFPGGDTYGLQLDNSQFGISALDFIEHCLDEKTGDLLNVKRLSDQEIAYYHNRRNYVLAGKHPTDEQIAMDRLDVNYSKTGHTFTKTDNRGYGKLRLYGHNGNKTGHSFESVTNASPLFGGVPRVVAQFQSGEFYRIAVDNAGVDVHSFAKEAAQGIDMRAKRMSQQEVTEFLLARNFLTIRDRPASAAEARQMAAQQQVGAGVDVRR